MGQKIDYGTLPLLTQSELHFKTNSVAKYINVRCTITLKVLLRLFIH